MSSRSKSSTSSIKSNGNSSNINSNCIRSTQPPIARPYTSSENGRSTQHVRSSQPSKKSINGSTKTNYSPMRNSSYSNTPSLINRKQDSHTAINGRREPSSFAIKSYLNDPTCISLRQQLMESDDPSEIYDQLEDAQLKKLVSHLKEYEQDNALNENYIEASKSHHLSVEIHEILKIRKKNEINESFFATSHAGSRNIPSPSSKIYQEEEEYNSEFYFNNEAENINDLDDNEVMASNKIKQFEQSYQEDIDKYQNETDEKIEKLKELHKQQMDKLEKLWKEKKPAQYRKPSAHLLQLKTIERSLALTGDYERAIILHKETEALTKQEMADAQKRLVYDYKISKSKLVQKQNSEFNQLQKLRQEGLVMMEKKHVLKRQRYENRDKVIQQQKNQLASKRLNQASQSLSLPAPIIQEKLGLVQSNLLPELIPPNDSEFVKEEEKKARDENKRRLELQKRNMDVLSQIYKVRNDEENYIKNDDQNELINNTNNNKDQNKQNDKNDTIITNDDQNENINVNDNDNDITNNSPKKDRFSMKVITDTLSAVTGCNNDNNEKKLENEEEEKGETKSFLKNALELAEAIEGENDSTKAQENEENKESTNDEAKNEIKEENKESTKSKDIDNIPETKLESNGEEKKLENKETKSEEDKNPTNSTENENDQKSLETDENQNEKSTEIEEDKKSSKQENEESKKSESEEISKDAKLENDQKEDSIKPENEENGNSKSEDDNKSTKMDSEENKEEIKSEDKEQKSEENKEETNNSGGQNENEPKSLLDASVLNSLIGSAHPKSHEENK